MGQAKCDKKLRKALAKGFKKAAKARAKGEAREAPLGLPGPPHRPTPWTGPPVAPAVSPDLPGQPGSQPHGRERWWLLAVAALSLPSLAFALLHQPRVAGSYLYGGVPEWLEVLLVWLTVLAGRFGPACTLVAVGLAAGGSLSGVLRPRVQAILWLAVALSGLACCYAWQVPA